MAHALLPRGSLMVFSWLFLGSVMVRSWFAHGTREVRSKYCRSLIHVAYCIYAYIGCTAKPVHVYTVFNVSFKTRTNQHTHFTCKSSSNTLHIATHAKFHTHTNTHTRTHTHTHISATHTRTHISVTQIHTRAKFHTYTQDRSDATGHVTVT